MKIILYVVLINIYLGAGFVVGAEVESSNIKSKGSTSVTQIFAFGDSYSDNGASFKLTKVMVSEKVKDATILPGELYWEGRWTNGPTAVEILADQLQVKLINYAVGGAKTGTGNYYHWMDSYENTSVIGQVEKFQKNLKEKHADPNAIYFIFISANDYFEYVDYEMSGTVSDLVNNAVKNIETAVTRLARLGAVRFMIVNSTDLTFLPAVLATGQTDLAKDFQTSVNDKLLKRIEGLKKQLGSDIILFDHVAVSNSIKKDPALYGIKNLSSPCQPVYPEVKPVCKSADSYYFWDEWHPTRRVHEIMGKEMAAVYRK